MKERVGRGAQNRLRIIRAAADLLHQRGARATSPDDIIEASHTGKGQFYHYFRNKEGLVHLIRQDVSLIFEVVKHKLASFFLKEQARGRLKSYRVSSSA